MDQKDEIKENEGADLSMPTTNSQSSNGPIMWYLIWYLIGAIFFIIMLVYLFEANDYLSGKAKIGGDSYAGMYQTYVGGDAYNYIIAGTYSTTIMVRSLIFCILGSASFLMGKISEKK